MAQSTVSGERLPLLQRSVSIKETVRRSFVRLALAIGIAHAAVTTSLSLGTVVLAHTFAWSDADDDGSWACPPLSMISKLFTHLGEAIWYMPVG